MNRLKLNRPLFLVTTAFAVSASIGLAQEPRAMDRVREFVAEGAFSLNLRARFERVDQSNADTANALTLRTRIGYLTRLWRGFRVMFEAEHVGSPFPNSYNQSQLNPGGAGKAIVTDPTGAQLHQAYVSYTLLGDTHFKAGRQRLTFGNGRFIGAHDWRQHAQTFDAVAIENHSFEKLTLSYAYIARVNRVFGRRHAQGVYDSNSHALHASYRGLPGGGELSAYAYLLDFKAPVVANSCATYGVSYANEHTFEPVTVGYRAEVARQSEYGDSPLFYSANFYSAEISAAYSRVRLGVGYELQESDNGFPFRTPLASLHEFNGWADAFLLTPAQGLRDAYVTLHARLPWRIDFAGAYHQFDTDTGLALGSELDLQAAYQINESLSAQVKHASFRSDSAMSPNVEKIWVQCELTF